MIANAYDSMYPIEPPQVDDINEVRVYQTKEPALIYKLLEDSQGVENSFLVRGLNTGNTIRINFNPDTETSNTKYTIIGNKKDNPEYFL